MFFMKSNRLTNLALGLGLLVTVGGGVTSGCGGHGAVNEGYILRRQLQAHGEFHGQRIDKVYNSLYKELTEKQSRGELPKDMNINQYYDWKKQQEAYEQELKAREDALKAIESGKKY